MANDTIDALESLIRSEGWRIFCETARAEFAERERKGRLHALKDTDDSQALNKLRQIVAAQEAIEWVLALPMQEVGRLKRLETPSSPETEMVRPLTPDVVLAMSRRGNL